VKKRELVPHKLMRRDATPIRSLASFAKEPRERPQITDTLNNLAFFNFPSNRPDLLRINAQRLSEHTKRRMISLHSRTLSKGRQMCATLYTLQVTGWQF